MKIALYIAAFVAIALIVFCYGYGSCVGWYSPIIVVNGAKIKPRLAIVPKDGPTT